MTPAPEPSCQACRFHRVLANEALGRCRRFPPVIYSHLGYGPNLHPQVAPDDWCGEFKPKE